VKVGGESFAILLWRKLSSWGSNHRAFDVYFVRCR